MNEDREDMEAVEDKSKNAIISCPIYHRDVMIHLGDLDGISEHLNCFLNNEHIDEIKECFSTTSRGKTIELNEGQIIVYLPKIPKTASGIATLVHELFHATHFVMEKAGITFSNDSDEAYAYLLDYLVENALTTFSLSPQQ